MFVSHRFTFKTIMDAYDTFGRAADTKALKVVVTRWNPRIRPGAGGGAQVPAQYPGPALGAQGSAGISHRAVACAGRSSRHGRAWRRALDTPGPRAGAFGAVDPV